MRATRPLELIHSDVFGRVRTPSCSGKRYMLTFIDSFSRYVWVYFLTEKSSVFRKFIEFKSMVENELNQRIRCLRP